MLAKLQQIILGITARATKAEESHTLRRVVLGAAKLARRPDELSNTLAGLMETAKFHEAECETWLRNDHIGAGEAGPFDACDLGAWLEIAARANVPAVPARHILHLTEEEAEFASGSIDLGNSPVLNRARTLIGRALPDGSAGEPNGSSVDPAAVIEKLYDAMEGVERGWMVRSAHCGHNDLKALAGCGLTGDTAPEVRFGAELEVGPGWVRNGNRRRVNVQDQRILELHAQGPHRGMDFYARPWVESARYIEGEDPNRANTPIAGLGRWPMEWRAFVRGGKVEGVSNYYGFIGQSTPENARMALAVRGLAQKMVDAMTAQGLVPRFMNLEHARRRSEVAAVLEQNQFGRDDVGCTLDFLETKDGLVLLEGGPPSSPVGGGHPCCFAGCGGKPSLGNPIQTQGVAFRPMSHVLVADPSTWTDGDRAGAILGWAEVAQLALTSID